MPTSCIITFNENPTGVYYGGQTFSGKVHLTTFKVKSIKGIHIKISGYAEVRWSESESSNGKSETRYFRARDDYFESRINALGTLSSDRFDLLPGRYEYHFQITLPTQLPSSFNGQYGTVRYEVICTIERPWKFDNVFKHPFTIISPMDLNETTMYSHPVERATKQSFSKICCYGNAGDIMVKGTIPCGGFVPGQGIPLSLLIKNNADVTTSETNACLIQVVEYRSHTPYRKSRYEIKPVTLNLFGPLDKHEAKKLDCNLLIPSVAPTSLQTCAIIEISYYVEVQLKIRGVHRNMDVRLPVTIGTIPYFAHVNRVAQNVHGSTETTSTLDVLPPSYEEAIKLGPAFESHSDEDKFIQSVDFQPRYPVYNIGNITEINEVSTNGETTVVTTQPVVRKRDIK